MAESQTSITATANPLDRVPGAKQFLLLVGIAAAVALGVALVLWSHGPSMSVLEGNLEPRDVSAIQAALQQAGIEVQADSQAGVVRVASSRLDEARLLLAGENLPSSSGGFRELVESEAGFGMGSAANQNRFLYALQGELEKTISSIDAVRGARVHIALAKDTPFVSRKEESTASVWVDLNRGQVLEPGQVQSIARLVASAVPGMAPGQVTVVDQSGRLLNSPQLEDEAGAASRQIAIRREQESTIANRIQQLLEPQVGIGGVRAQVSLDLDFDEFVEVTHRYDGETVERSASRTLESMVDGVATAAGVPGALSNQPPASGGQSADDARGPVPSRESRQSTVNYEVPEQKRVLRRNPGSVRRLSVAVVIDDQQVRQPDGKFASQPWSAEQLANMEALVKSAVGFQADRGDLVKLVNQSFLQPEPIPASRPAPMWKQPWVLDAARQGFAGLMVLVLALAVVRPIMRNLTGSVKGVMSYTAGQPALVAPGASAAPALPQERLQAARNMVNDDPNRVAQIVRAWVAQDAKE